MNTDRLEKLIATFGVSSAEEAVAKTIKENYEAQDVSIKKDRLGSIFAYKASKAENAKTLMIATPLDEFGCMVSEVRKDGSLSFIQLEGFALNSFLNQRVCVLTRDNKCIYGVVSTKKKVLEDKCEIKTADDLCIKCALPKERVLEMVRPGDLVGYAANFVDGEIMMGKALAIRSLNEVTMALLEKIKDEEFEYNIALGCIAQSTIGYRGTQTATYVIKPNMAIALTGFDGANNDVTLGDGVIVGYYDKQMLPSKRLLADICSQLKPKAYFGFTGNDGSFIHKTLGGTPCVSVGMPVINMGSANEMVAKDDVNAVVDGLYAYLHHLNNEIIDNCGFGDEND